MNILMLKYYLRLLAEPEIFRLSFRVLWKLHRSMRHEKIHEIKGRFLVNSYLPALPSQAFGRYLRALRLLSKKEMKMVPQVLIMSVTDRCPYNCYHCSNDFPKSKSHPAIAGLRKIIEEFIAAGVYKIGFSGGEPFLRDDLLELVALASPNCQTMINTTGFNVDRQKLSDLKKAGLTGIRVSLDHYDEKEFDSLRGFPGAYKNAIECLKDSVEAGLYTSIAFVPSRSLLSEKELDRFIACAEATGAHEITVFEPKPAGRLFDRPAGYFFNDQERKFLADLQVRINGDKRRKIKILSFPYLEGNGMIGCIAGSLNFYADSDGSIFPCLFYPFSLGNALAESVEDIIKRAQAIFDRPKCFCLAFQGKDIIAGGKNIDELKKLSHEHTVVPDFYKDLMHKKNV